jgi:murein DD-endopeptidase MepM/ murein hydrolase activator NlpD
MRARGRVAPVAGGLAVALALAAAGCSSDVTRFRLGSNGATGSIPMPHEPVGLAGVSKGQGSASAAGFSESDLAPVDKSPNYDIVGRKSATAYPPPTLGPPPKQPPAVADGGSVVVQPGDTIYSIARRHAVAPAAIKDANGLHSDTLQPGQRLVIPSTTHDGRKVAAVPPPAVEPKLVKIKPIAVVPAPAPVSPPPGWEGTYVMKQGDSLYGIAYQHKVPLEDLKRVNGITDPTRVRFGTTLMVPARPEAVAKGPPPAKDPPRVNALPDKTAKSGDLPPHAKAEASDGKFRWPVRGGKTLAGFGKRPDGTHNDGINLAVPVGTDIHAAEAGKVAYAGNELKGYGNLILIRHSDKWVSAYAHADQILVRNGDQVRKGQVIAKAGKTGAVDQPQLHFELRQDSRPVDPLPHMASN